MKEQYKPSREEIKNAESMLTYGQREQSEERFSELKQRAKEWVPLMEDLLEAIKRKDPNLGTWLNDMDVKKLEKNIEFAKEILERK